MKKLMSFVMSLIMVFSLVSVASATETTLQPNAEGLYPNAVYTIPAEELDSDGKWIYRELAIDGGFEEGCWNGGATTGIDFSDLDSNVKRSGDTSFKQTVSAQYKRMGVELDAALEANKKYRISYYVNPSRTVEKLVDRLVYSYPKPTNPSLNNLEDRTESRTLNLVANTWNFAAYTRTFTGGANFDDAVSPHYSAFSYDTNDFATAGKLTMYLDDYSVRRVPGLDFASSYTKSISPAKSYPVINNGDEVTFTFSLDIDSRTVTKENIFVNGVAGANIESVEVSTNESTRETTLAIKLSGLTEGGRYTISLDKLKDAWGRAVVGASEATVYYVESERQYTIFEDLDADGKWIYRELAVDGGFEEGYWNGNASVDSSGLDSTVKHSGNTSFKQTVSAQFKRMGVVLDTALEENAKYRISYYVNPSRAVARLNDRLVYGYPNPKNSAVTNLEDRAENKTLNLVANTWNFAAYTRTFTGGNNFGNAKKPYYSAFSYDIDDVNADNTLTMYLDDYSVRRVPDEDFASVNLIGKSISADRRTVTFTFDKDIDSRFAVAENIVAGGETVSNITVTTNEITRVTTMAVTFADEVDADAVSYSNSLKDAWGREIKVKEQKLTFETPVLSGNSFSVSNIENYSGKTVKLAVIIAGFNGNTMEEIKIDSVILNNGETANSLTATLEGNASNVRVFIWDMFTLLPYYAN